MEVEPTKEREKKRVRERERERLWAGFFFVGPVEIVQAYYYELNMHIQI